MLRLETMLNSGPYIILNKDPSPKYLIEVKLNVKNSVVLNDQTKRMVILSIANCARFYTLPKIHIPTLPFHRNFFIVGTDSYKFVRFLSQSLAHLTCSRLYTVENSYDFVDKLKLISPSNYAMLSLGVKSLFTNFPIQRVLDCLEKRLCEFHYSAIEIEEILNIVHLCPFSP